MSRTCFVCRFFVVMVLGAVIPNGFGQGLRRDWVRTYSNVGSKYNIATAIAVTPDGNIVVAGTSANPSGNLDYQLIKYSPDGQEIWRARYDFAEAEFFDDELRGMTVDPAGNVIVTGTTATVKFNPAGERVWAVSLPGRALIATSEFVYVTGFSDTDISTAQLQNNNIDGAENWRRFVNGPQNGIDVGQTITLDGSGNVYVGGQVDRSLPLIRLSRKEVGVVSYSPAGVQRWVNWIESGWDASIAQATSILLGKDEDIYVYGEYSPTAIFAKFDPTGTPKWFYINNFAEAATKMLRSKFSSDFLLTGGKDVILHLDSFRAAFVAGIADTNTANGQPARQLWQYLDPNGGHTQGNDIAQDSEGNLYVAGRAAKDAMLAKLNQTGEQLGLDRYADLNSSENAALAMAIDKKDNVYVTGFTYDGTSISQWLTIKYPPASKIELKPDGAAHLEFHASPNQQYAIEGSTDFFNWQSLITNTADASGLVKFDDTNAVTIPYRFYRGKQP